MTGADRLAAAARERSENVTASRGVERFVEQLPAAAAGAGSGALFGLPEYIAKQIDGEGFEDWERQNEGFRVGEVAGTIGSAFVPLGGLAGKGLQALGKAAGAGRVGAGLTRAGQFLQGTSAADKTANLGRAITRAAVRGGLEGGAESALRAGFGERDILPEALAGTAGGAIFGGLSGALGRGVEALTEARKGTRDAVLSTSGLDTRAVRGGMKKTDFGSKGRTVMSPENLKDELYDFVQRNRNILYGQEDDIIEALYKKNKSAYDELDRLYRQNSGDIVARTNQYVRDAGPEIAEEIMSTPNAMRGIEDLGEQLSKTSTLVGKRKRLSEIIKKTGQRIEDEGLHKAARIMSEALDDEINQLAMASGSRTLQDIGKDWKMQEVFADSIKREGSKLPGAGTGSATAEKTAMQRIMGYGTAGGTSGAGLAALGSDWEDPENIPGNVGKIALAGLLGSGLAGSLGAAKNVGLSGLDSLLRGAMKNPALVEKVSSALQPIASATGRAGVSTLLAADRAGKAVDAREERVQQMELGLEAPSRQEGRQEARELGQEAKAEQQGQPSDYMNMVEQKLYQRFASLYPDYAQDEEAFSQFMEGARKASSDFDPKRTAKLLFPREEDRKAYLAALSARQSVDKNLPGVGEKDAGLFGFGLGAKQLDEQQLGARATLEGAFLEAAKLANVDAKNARAVLQSIVDGKDSLTKKREKILAQVRAWNEQGFDALTRAGLGG